LVQLPFGAAEMHSFEDFYLIKKPPAKLKSFQENRQCWARNHHVLPNFPVCGIVVQLGRGLMRLSWVRFDVRCFCLLALIFSGAPPTTLASAQTPLPCQNTLGYLASTIPTTGYAQLDSLRQQILDTDIRDVITKMAAQHMSIDEAVNQATKQADADQANLPTIEQSIRGSAASASKDTIMLGLKTRDYSKVSLGDDVLGAATRSYIADDWGELANRETAKQLRCFGSQRPNSPIGRRSIPQEAAGADSAYTQQAVATSPSPIDNGPIDNGPSLKDTMQFILDKLGEQGIVSYKYEISKRHRYKLFKSVWLSDISVNAAVCRLDFRWHQTVMWPSIDDQVQDLTITFPLQGVRSIDAMTAERYQMTEDAYGDPSKPAKVDSPVFVLVLRVKPEPPSLQTHNEYTDFFFKDESVANRVAKAMAHAVDLCGGGKKIPETKDPF
jgi:hypothetical protein